MRRSLSTFALGAAVLCALAAPASAQRHDFASGGVSQLGGQILPGRSALAAGGLYPGAWFQFTMGLSRRFDLGLRGDLYYASPFENVCGPGLGFSIPMRLGLTHGGKVSIALKLAPSLVAGDFEDDRFDGAYCHSHGPQGWHCHDSLGAFRADGPVSNFGMGVGFEFGVLLGIPVGIVNIVCGATSPFAVMFYEDHDGADLYFPVTGFGGAEIRLTERLNVFGLLQPGVTIHSNDHGHESQGFFRLWGGVEVTL